MTDGGTLEETTDLNADPRVQDGSCPKTIHNTQVEALLDEWNLRWELEIVEIAAIVDIDDQQVRNATDRAIPESVETYALQMDNGAAFPPILLRHPNTKIDGNTRLAAAIKLGMTHIWAYVVRDITTNGMARYLGGTINNKSGHRLTDVDAQNLAADVIKGDLNLPISVVQRDIGLSQTQVRKFQKQAEVHRHADRLGITVGQLNLIPPNQMERLAKVALDEPFRSLVHHLGTKKPPASEAATLIKDLANLASETEQMDLIEDAAAGWKPTGPANRVVRNKAAQMARMYVGGLTKAAPGDVFDPEKATEDRQMFQRLREWADGMLAVYDARGVL